MEERDQGRGMGRVRKREKKSFLVSQKEERKRESEIPSFCLNKLGKDVLLLKVKQNTASPSLPLLLSPVHLNSHSQKSYTPILLYRSSSTPNPSPPVVGPLQKIYRAEAFCLNFPEM